MSNIVSVIMRPYEKLCQNVRPDAVLVVGDVSSSVAVANIASAMDIPLIHLEAGLRCFDPTLPEEANRIAIDRMADLHLTPSPDADANLLAEGISPNRIKRVGNIMIDTAVMMSGAINQDRIADQLGVGKGQYIVVTLHRPGNVDIPERLSRICQGLCDIARDFPVCMPLHPRTEKQLKRSHQITVLEQAGIRLFPPLGYAAFGRLIRGARLVITDSGGVQEETSWLGIPCLTLRPSTERPVTITEGTNRLVTVDGLVKAVTDCIRGDGCDVRVRCQIPLWDGHTAHRVVQELNQFLMTGVCRQ
jgi:UDP-N-acetylglucosamine 2-epimerase (non-hydrolysing)